MNNNVFRKQSKFVDPALIEGGIKGLGDIFSNIFGTIKGSKQAEKDSVYSTAMAIKAQNQKTILTIAAFIGVLVVAIIFIKKKK